MYTVGWMAGRSPPWYFVVVILPEALAFIEMSEHDIWYRRPHASQDDVPMTWNQNIYLVIWFHIEYPAKLMDSPIVQLLTDWLTMR